MYTGNDRRKFISNENAFQSPVGRKKLLSIHQ